MATITLKAGMVWKGAYDASVTYDKLDVVCNADKTQIAVCKQGGSGIPLTNSNYWEVSIDASGIIALLEDALAHGEIYTMKIGSVTTGATSSATIVNNHQTHETVLNLVLEKGEKGDKGDKGDRGEQGDTIIIGDEREYTLYNQTGNHTDGAMTQAAVTEEFEKLDEEYARNDGYYESMGVGTATNLKGQNTVDAEFTYRKSGGNVEVQDGNAMIEAIKGNTLAWNQLINDRASYIDMGLPSGTLWCKFNVGATAETEDGLYLSWGNVDGHTANDGYDFGTNNDGVYAQTSGAALAGNIPLNDTYDAACNNKGAIWRMPTASEFQELYSNCTTEWTNQNGVNGCRFTSRINGNSLFFPASGYRGGTSLNNRGSGGFYWSSALASAANAWNMNVIASGVNPANASGRFCGFSVRAVITPNIVQQGELNKKYLFDKDNLFDLTLIYGSGKEPTTVEQFEQDYFNWFGKPLTYEPYDAGSLRNTKVSALKTIGFNQWDEEWELGTLDNNTGQKTDDSNRFRSKNYIPVVEGKPYYLCGQGYGGGIDYLFYDYSKSFIERHYISFGSTFAVPSGCKYMMFRTWSGNTYNHDICINISDPNRNGEYEPYKESTLPLDVTTLTGKLNGEGSSVVVFADGMNSAGDVYDEICVVDGVTKAIKRVSSSHEVLAEPEVYVLDDFNLPKLYPVANGGTEEQLSNSPNSLPATLSIRYGLNAAAFIQNAPKNYISKESMSNFLGNLGSAMGGTWSMTWNSSTNKYDFSFVQNRSVDVEQPIEDK